MSKPRVAHPTQDEIRAVLRRERLEGARPAILVACMMEASRCLGVAQAKDDRPAMDWWALRSEAYRVGLLEAVEAQPHAQGGVVAPKP